MHAFIDACLDRSRAVIIILILILSIGYTTYQAIPREDAPDVKIPIIYVSMTHEGISPQDAERLLVRPMEKELKTIEGIKELRATAAQGYASVVLEFDAGFDSDKALLDVREKVDVAKSELPEETKEPTVNEVNISLFPVVSVILTADIPERSFLKLAKKLRDKVEGLPEVLSVDIAGERIESLEIIINPLMLESYGLTSDIVQLVDRNNKLVAAGALDSAKGKYNIKVPGLIEGLEDLYSLPIKISGDSIVRLGDIAEVRPSYKDPLGFARVNGQPALVLEIKKRTGENIIDTVNKVRGIVKEESQYWPSGINVIFAQDKSSDIITMVNELQNNILLAVLLVTIVMIFYIGMRSAFFISMAIPGAFLFGILILSFYGVTLNIVVLFGLILSIGMLVDNAIVVIEYANRLMIDGMSHKKAYGEASKRMAWPIIASTITTLLVFAPLLFWPGIMGQFMKYLPMTLIATLTGSLFMALIFIPALGKWFGKADTYDKRTQRNTHNSEQGDLNELTGFTARYVKLLNKAITRPKTTILLILVCMFVIIVTYTKVSPGTEFFPTIEPQNATVIVRARGNLSTIEKDKILKQVESRIMHMTDEIEVFYARSGSRDGAGNSNFPSDTVGTIQLEFLDWQVRRPSSEILADIKAATDDLAGVIIETRKQKEGPGEQRAINIEVGSRTPELIAPVVKKILAGMNEIGEFVEINDSLPIPAIEWEMKVDRAQAAKFGVDINIIGNFIKLVTNGLKASTYRPDDSDDEVDISIRFPKEYRGVEQLDNLRAITSDGAIPIAGFVKRQAQQTVEEIEKVDSVQVISIEADVEAGIIANNKIAKIKDWLKTANIDPRVEVKFKGDDEQQKETGDFLGKAFVFAIVAMMLVLLLQFNSMYHTFIILSAVFLSTGGVFLGLLVTYKPFGIVMCGVGVIALAGIVVNNNIIFIDTYTRLKKQGMDTAEALLRTGAQRLRPILLTAGTTVLGLVPMVTTVNIDFMTRDITVGAPSSQWWEQMSTSIAGGLTFATVLTLFLTPCLLAIGENRVFKKIKNTLGTKG
jgi:multidrug efflux pump